MTERTITVGDVELCVETYGDPADPAILLLAGAATTMDLWDPKLCARLAAGGRHVVRFDHRDTGRSTMWPRGRPGYPGSVLGTDPVALLGALGVSAAHFVGVSMGGGIAQGIAAREPERVKSLTLIATSAAGERSSPDELPPMAPRVVEFFENPPPDPPWEDRDAVIEHLTGVERLFLGSLRGSAERSRRTATRTVDRCVDVAATAENHWVVIESGGDEPPIKMSDIRTPTLVIHGTEDPMFPVEHGRSLAKEIAGAELITIDGMGHEPPPPATYDMVVDRILRHTRAA